MKNSKHKILTVILALLLALSLAACGGGGGGSDKQDPSAYEEAYPVAIEAKYDLVYHFSEGLAPVMLDRKWGYIDKTGEEVIPLIYDVAWEFSDGLGLVKIDDKFGYIDKTGEEVIPLQFCGAAPFSEGFARVRYEENVDPGILYIDKTGAELTSLFYSAEPFSEGLACVQDGMMNYVFIDTTGAQVIDIEPTNYRGREFSEGLSLVYHMGPIGFMDKTGAIAIPLEGITMSIDVEDFSEGLAYIDKVGFEGFIDTTGAEVITLGEEAGLVKSFSEGLAVVSLWGREWSYIDKTGEIVIQRECDWAYSFNEGYAAIEFDGKIGFINKENEVVVPFQFDMVDMDDLTMEEMEDLDNVAADSAIHQYKVSEGMAAIMVGDKWGFIAMPQ